jgi:hypothetical protein
VASALMCIGLWWLIFEAVLAATDLVQRIV